MITRHLKRALCVIVLSFIATPAWAHLSADKTVINSSTGKAVVRVSFATPIKGDLYLATIINSRWYFFADNGAKFSPDVAAFIKNGYFVEDRELLTLFSNGIPAGIYSLYQVVTYTGKTPLDFRNWIGGQNSLSELQLRINLPADIPSTDAGEECSTLKPKDGETEENSSETCTPSPVVDGKALFNQQCASCHGSNPKQNVNKVLKGKDAGAIREAIKKNKGNMGILNSLNDADLQAIANYLKAF